MSLKKMAILPTHTSTAPHRTRVGRLKTATDVAKFIARCIRKTEGGGDENRKYKQVMMASMLLKAIELSDLEERVSSLERRLVEERNLT
jgi:hypothetical protein